MKPPQPKLRARNITEVDNKKEEIEIGSQPRMTYNPQKYSSNNPEHTFQQ
jgi:hypothetical protein